MKSFAKVVMIIVSLCTGAAFAQGPYAPARSSGFEVAGQFTAVYANAAPGDCGCFFMYGGNAQVAAVSHTGLALVGDVGGSHATNINGNGHDLTLTTYMAGVRYYPSTGQSRFSVYGQILAGASHTTSNYAIDNDATRFGAAVGGGVNYKLARHLQWRITEAEYLLTRIPNAKNEIQNQLRLSSGLVYRFGH